MSVVKLCLACHMELLPYRDENGDVVKPERYCDDVCENIYHLYGPHFRRSRNTIPSDGTLPCIDLRL